MRSTNLRFTYFTYTFQRRFTNTWSISFAVLWSFDSQVNRWMFFPTITRATNAQISTDTKVQKSLRVVIHNTISMWAGPQLMEDSELIPFPHWSHRDITPNHCNSSVALPAPTSHRTHPWQYLKHRFFGAYATTMERVPKRCWNLATSSRLWTGNQAFKALCAAWLRASATLTGLSFGRSRPQQAVISNANLTRVTPAHFLQAHDSNMCRFQFINQQAGWSRFWEGMHVPSADP